MKYNLHIVEERMENGMQVVLVQKKDYEKSLFLLGIPAGGFNIEEEKDGIRFVNPSGCAHFLEHQMFRLNGKDVTNDFALMQAQPNAFTSYTETAYYFSTTADPIPPLKLLLDFVQTLDITEESVNKEKGIILSEYNMCFQQPESRLLHETFKSLYQNHPLTIDILGKPEDIQNMTVENLQTFYNTNYDPSRLILVGVTGRDPQTILEGIRSYEKEFPSLENRNSHAVIEEKCLDVVRERYSETMDISKPFVCVAYKLEPVKGIEKNIRRDTLISIWLDAIFGPMNPDYQSWIDSHLISQAAGAEADFADDHAYLFFFAQTDQIDAFEKLIDSLVSTKSIEPAVFEALQIQNVARNLRCLDNFETLAVDLLHSKIENFDYFQTLELTRNITVQDVENELAQLDFSRKSVTVIEPGQSDFPTETED